jgi:SAM-dependent methyltransferase
MLKKFVLKALYPGFVTLMRNHRLRRWVESFHDTHPNMKRVRRFITPFYMEWYGKNVQYSSSNYQLYQAKYWDTIGQWRWASSFDYSDMLGTLKKHLADDRSLLDVGCGHGEMLAEIGKHFPALRLTGIDGSEKMCDLARAKSPQANIVCDHYGPHCRIEGDFDVVVARSTLTYVDETDIQNVLSWLASITRRLLIISEPSGIHDGSPIEQGLLEVARLSDNVYKRLYDHTHIRDYASYALPLKLDGVFLEKAHNNGNRQWIFTRVPQSH